MKTCIFPLVSGLATLSVVLVNVSHAQTGGTVNFANHSTCLVTNGQTASPVTSANGVKTALYWAPTSLGSFTPLGTNVTVGNPVDGIFAAGTRYTPDSGGSVGFFQVRAWGGGYTTYEQALAVPGTLVGTSVVLQVTTGNPLGDPPTPPASLVAAGLQSFTLNPTTGQPLVLNCASNKTVTCGTAWQFDAPTTNGGCGSVTLTILSTATNGSCPQRITRTWQATDGCITNTCSQTVTNVDDIPPVITCASNKSVECSAAWTFDAPIATDACNSNTVSVLSTITNAGCGNTFTATRTWIATDACGNTSSCSQTVTTVDTTAPVLTCAGNKTFTCGGTLEFDPPTASDSCSGTNVTVTVLATITNIICPLAVTRTWLATDACGNTNTCSQTVTGLHLNPPVLTCASSKIVSCTNAWDFDAPAASDECGGTNLTVAVLGTVTNGVCPLVLTRTWAVTNGCDTNLITCSQTVTILCPDCPVLLVTKLCPPYPVPPGGTLVWAGTVTNAGDITVSNVVVLNDQPSPNIVVFGPATMSPGASANFGGSYSVPGCSCGPHPDTLTVSGVAANGIVFSNSVTVSCAGTNVVVPGDTNGDGIVDQAELNVVLANYWAHSPWVYMTNAALVCDGKFQFELTNVSAWNFSVLVTTNLQDWTNLPTPAIPVYQFHDPEGTNAPQRLYRLRWP